MGIEILSKEGCQYCDFATNLCIDYGLEYKKTMVNKDELSKKCGKTVSVYPQILINDNKNIIKNKQTKKQKQKKLKKNNNN